MSNTKKNRFLAVLFFTAIFLSSYFIYFTHTSGDFIFDDIPNLSSLENVNHHSVFFTGLTEYLATNNSGHLGRPISLFTFALQAEHWPNNVSAFKTVNVLLHFMNSILIFLLSKKLFNAFTSAPYHQLPWLIAFFWVIHPIHVSTVLYTVQRMTLLMAFFSLLSLITYLHGREISKSNFKKGSIIASISLFLGGILATLSKENGVLIILYIAAIELTFLKDQPPHKYWKIWLSIFIYTPIILAIIYVLSHLNYFIQGHANRPFTFSEHLLTNTRVVLEYIIKIFIPKPDSFGLFFDDYIISKSFFSPISTLFSSLTLLFIFIIICKTKNKHPILAFSFLWFFAGHALESSIISLELYYEHRNYLPSFGLILGLSVFLLNLKKQKNSQVIKISTVGFTLIYMASFWFIAYQEAKLWSRPDEQAIVWQKNHPNSKRATALAAQSWIHLNKPENADELFLNLSKIDPKDTASHFMRLNLHCYINHLNKQDLIDIETHLSNAHTDNATPQTVKKLVLDWNAGKCKQIKAAYLINILQLILNNPSSPDKNAHIISSLSYMYASENNYEKAISLLDNYIKEHPSQSELVLMKIRWGIANKQYDDSLKWIQETKGINLSRIRKKNIENQLITMEHDIKLLK